MKTAFAWLKAARLASQSYIFVPLVAGQAFFVMQDGKVDWTLFGLVHLYGLFMQLYIVFANDLADAETDRLNNTFTVFSGGSRVLVDGDITPHQLRNAAIAMATCCLLAGGVFTFFYHRFYIIPIIAFGLVLVWMYSFPPVKMSYRGGGEILQMIGVGIVLPMVGYYGQSGAILAFPWETMAVILPSQLACAAATSLPDEPSDRVSGKHTAAVNLGLRGARWLVFLLNAAAVTAGAALFWLGVIEFGSYWLLPIPAIATLALLFVPRAVPGKSELSLFVGVAIFVTLSLLGVLALAAAFPELFA